MTEDWRKRQAELNIGTTGHVDHGKTTLTWALSGIWAARHSEELRRGITLRLGYADTVILKCPNCPPPQCYTTYALSGDTCKYCGSKLEFLRKYSFVDCPGHEIARPLRACNVKCLWQLCLPGQRYLTVPFS